MRLSLTTEQYAAPVCDVNPKFLQKVALLTGAVEQFVPMASGKRQIFHPEIGRDLAKLRELKQLSQGQVALRGKGKITEGTLKAIETGRVKNPDPDHLRTLATIYGVPFRVIAEPFVLANYGRDLIRQTGDQQSGSSSTVGDSPDETVAARLELEQLRERVAQYDQEVRKMRTLADDVFQTAIALEEVRVAAKAASPRRRHDRKTG